MLARLSEFLKDSKASWFTPEENQLWKNWVDFKRREKSDLEALLDSDVRDSFRARAIFLLMLPTEEWNGIYWTGYVGRPSKMDFLKKLSPPLLLFAASLVRYFLELTKPETLEKDDLSLQEAYYFYNNCILDFLSLLPEKEASKMFDLFSINDPGEPWWHHEDASGYRPLRTLFFHQDVGHIWKRRAHAKMRDIIADEVSGRKKPRADHEDALRCYSEIVQSQLFRDERPGYPVDLFADQIRLLVSGNHYGRKLLYEWKVPLIFSVLAGDIYKEIRHQVARFVLFGNKENFWIWDKESRRAADVMLAEFGEDDPELSQCIQTAIREAEEKEAKSQEDDSRRKQTESDLLSQMK